MTVTTMPTHRHPIARSGGLFLVLIGAGLLAGIALSGDVPVGAWLFSRP